VKNRILLTLEENRMTMDVTDCVAIVISILALGTTIVFNVRDHKHKKLSVKPLLNTIISDTKEQLCFSLGNNGIGPAIVKKVTYTYKRKTYDHPDDVVNAIVEPINSKSSELLKKVKNNNLISNYAMTVGESKTLIRINLRVFESQEDLEVLLAELNKMILNVTFEDIYKVEDFERLT